MGPDFVACSNLIVDDIVMSDGRTYMGTLGGSATHALVGMRVWSDRLGFFAGVGEDLDPGHRAALEAIGVDLRGLIVVDGYPTARAWQLIEVDDRRIEIFRTDIDHFHAMEPALEQMPADYFRARGYHFNRGTLAEMADLVAALRSSNPGAFISWEPTPQQLSGSDEAIRRTLAGVDLFSPCLVEAEAMTDERAPRRMIGRLLDLGARLVALRMGSRGSFVQAAGGDLLRVPAVPVSVVDTTGAGNAYCGGFLVALADGMEVAEAAARAAVSASFAIEQFGVPGFDKRATVEARRRLAWARERVAPDDAC